MCCAAVHAQAPASRAHNQVSIEHGGSQTAASGLGPAGEGRLSCSTILPTSGDYPTVVEALMMPNLLTLSLTETTREEESYQVIARDLDNGRWVAMHVPRTQFRKGSAPVWDLFGVTRASYSKNPNDSRPEKCVLDPSVTPVLLESILDRSRRLELLRELSSRTIREIYDAPNTYFGVVPIDRCRDISMAPKRDSRQPGYDLSKLFFWEARIGFRENGSDSVSSAACKDLRWKKYWYDVQNNRPEQFGDVKRKWIDYMNTHHTFFIIEIYTLHRGVNHYAISGVHCLPFARERDASSV